MTVGKIRVLVVDDSVVVRRMVTDVLNADPDIEVVGAAANGRIALQKIPQLNPDLITLDVEMPDMDGLTALAEIRKTWISLPVIMFSTLTERGAATTLDALSLGASDYVTKPANVGSVTAAQQRIREDLIPKVKALCAKVLKGVPAPANAAAPRPAFAAGRPASTPANNRTIDLLAIGVSTGGPNALALMMPFFPADFPVPIVITQHMPPMFTRLLAERLTKTSSLPFEEGAPGARVLPSTAWVAPGDFHMGFERVGTQVAIRLDQGTPENSCRPAVDAMLRSAVAVYGSRILFVILTGMGRDGVRGAELVKAAGGQVLAQDEASSVVWGMPGFVVNAGLADAVLPLKDMADAIMRRVAIGRPAKAALVYA